MLYLSSVIISAIAAFGGYLFCCLEEYEMTIKNKKN